VPGYYLYKKGTMCFTKKNTVLNHTIIVDDLLVFADIRPIDGRGNILGQAGPCIVTTKGGIYSRVGAMIFDIADVEYLLTLDLFYSIILHEIGHMLGIGTLWKPLNLIGKPKDGEVYAPYLGKGGIQGQTDIGGTGNPLVEVYYGLGTAYGHWSEEVYGNELMTGFSLATYGIISKLTIEALQDVGHEVDVSQAQPYVLPTQGRRRLRSNKHGGSKSEYDCDTSMIREPYKIDDDNLVLY